MKSSERRLKLMLMLQQPGNKLTVAQLAERFGVSRRTIFRDMNSLQEINVPVTWDRYAGYGLMPGYKIPPLMFTSKELATIMVGLSFVKSQVDKTLVEDAQGVEVKIKNVLPRELKEFMTSLEETTVVDPYLNFGAQKKDGGNWYLISSAVSQKKRILFTYKSVGGKVTDRKIDPYILVFFKDHWNLIGFSHRRGDFRNFILDQISNIEILEENYTPKKNIEIEGLIFRSNEKTQKVVLGVEKVVLERLERNLPAKIFKKSQASSKIIKVEFVFDNLPFINEWLLQFADKVKILEPETLQNLRAEILEKMK